MAAPAGSVALESLFETEALTPDYSGMHYGDSCAVLWTSGTTGRSKGVLQSHNSWIRSIADSASIYYDSQPGDVIYNVLPLYTSAAWMTAVFRGLYEGPPVVIEPQFSVKTFWDRIRHFGATQTFTLGAMHGFLFNAPHFFVPLYIEFVDALPYTPTQKVQKYRLRERGITDKTWKRREAGFVVER